MEVKDEKDWSPEDSDTARKRKAFETKVASEDELKSQVFQWHTSQNSKKHMKLIVRSPHLQFEVEERQKVEEEKQKKMRELSLQNWCYLGANCVVTPNQRHGHRVEEETAEEPDIESIECTASLSSHWVHVECVNYYDWEMKKDGEKLLEERLQVQFQADRIKRYVCPECRQYTNLRTHYFTEPMNDFRHNPFEDIPEPLNKIPSDQYPMQVGSPAFAEWLLKQFHAGKWKDAQSHVMLNNMPGAEVNKPFFEKYGMNVPIFIPNKAGLDLCVPEGVTIEKFIDQAGHDLIFDCIEARRQSTIPISLGDFLHYWKNRDKVNRYRHLKYNIISCEFSLTDWIKKDTDFPEEVKEREHFRAPGVVRDISWHEQVVPNFHEDQPLEFSPEAKQFVEEKKMVWDRHQSVQYFCLMSVEGSFTDWHIDFGGSCVYYHIISGRKIFFLIKPTESNVEAFAKWDRNPNKGDFGNFLFQKIPSDQIFTLDFGAGQTIILPSGWIHCVYTPADSMVFGGNFLNSICIPMQLKTYDVETLTLCPENNRYPSFIFNCIYALHHLIEEVTFRLKEKKLLDEMSEEERNEPVNKYKRGPYQYEANGVFLLNAFLRREFKEVLGKGGKIRLWFYLGRACPERIKRGDGVPKKSDTRLQKKYPTKFFEFSQLLDSAKKIMEVLKKRGYNPEKPPVFEDATKLPWYGSNSA